MSRKPFPYATQPLEAEFHEYIEPGQQRGDSIGDETLPTATVDANEKHEEEGHQPLVLLSLDCAHIDEYY